MELTFKLTIWIILNFFPVLFSTLTETNPKLLLIIEEGSSQTIINLWNHSGTYNDPSNTRHNMTLEDALRHGDYRSSVLDSWETETPTQLLTGAYNRLGEPLWTISFNSSGTSFGLEWLSTLTYIGSWPESVTDPHIEIEPLGFTIANAADPSQFWFHMKTVATGGGALILFSKDGNRHTLNSEIYNYTYMGCYDRIHFDPIYYAGFDNDDMDRDMCRQMCTSTSGGSSLILLTNGNECNCGNNLTSQGTPLDEVLCNLSCPGNTTQKCGGYLGRCTTYTYTGPIPNYGSGAMGIFPWNVTNVTIPYISKINSSDLNGNIIYPLYIYGISVKTTNGEYIKYRLHYNINQCSSGLQAGNMTPYAINGSMVEFLADGELKKLQSLVFGCIWIQLEYKIQINSSQEKTLIIEFFYQDDLLMEAPFFVIHGIYETAEQLTNNSVLYYSGDFDISTTLADGITTSIDSLSSNTIEVTTVSVLGTSSNIDVESVSTATATAGSLTTTSIFTSPIDIMTSGYIQYTEASLLSNSNMETSSTTYLLETEIESSTLSTYISTQLSLPIETESLSVPVTISSLTTSGLITSPVDILSSGSLQHIESSELSNGNMDTSPTTNLLETEIGSSFELSSYVMLTDTESLSATSDAVSLTTSGLITSLIDNLSSGYIPHVESSVSETYMHMATDIPIITVSNVPQEQTFCPCIYDSCSHVTKWHTMTPEEKERKLQAEINKIKSELSITKAKLSSEIRKKSSADDKRPSSKYIGCAGIAMLLLAFGIIVMFDITSIMRRIHTVKKRHSVRISG